jgi:hypothetical protein
VLTSGGAGAAAAWEDAAGGVGCGPLRIAGGSNSAPAYSFSTGCDSDTGIYRQGANAIGFTVGGVCRMIFDGGGINMQNACSKIYAQSGTAGAPGIAFVGDSDSGMFSPGGNTVGWTTAGTERMRLCGTELRVGQDIGTAVGGMNTGISICQGECDDTIFTLKSSDVDHGITGTAETDSYLTFKKQCSSSGGVEMFGLSAATLAIGLHGIGTGQNTSKNTSGTGTIQLRSGKANGTAIASLGADGNLVSIHDHGVGVRFIFDVEGTSHNDVGTATYDDYNDVELLRGFLATTCDKYKQNYQDRFGQDLMYNQQWYEDNKLIGKCSIHYETRECGKVQQFAMVNMTGLTMLHHSTIIQLADQVNARLDGLETQLKALTEGK